LLLIRQVLLAHISGKIRKNYIKILVGDRVTMEISPCACASKPRPHTRSAAMMTACEFCRWTRPI